MPPVYLNHLYVVLDSHTYHSLFDSSYMDEIIGNVKTTSTVTSDKIWSGKYMHGRNGYLEFFSTEGLEGSAVGDFGLGFMTMKSNDIFYIKDIWGSAVSDTIELDTTTYLTNGAFNPWYYSIGLLTADSVSNMSTWIMENTPEAMLEAGFSEAEIQNKIEWPVYVERLTHKTFNKNFERIISVHLNVNTKEYEYLRRSFYGFGLRKRGNTFFNKYIRISCRIVADPGIRLKSFEIGLKNYLMHYHEKISANLSLQVKERKAIWTFD